MKSFIKKLTPITIALLLTACNLAITPPASSQLNLKPTPTLTLTPTLTPTPQATLTLVPPTVDPVFFRDEFDIRLAPGWTWMHEVPEQWSLTAVPGFLKIDTGIGFVNSQTMTNMLLRPAPAADFQIETKLTFMPHDNFQFAGLIIYDDDGTFLQAGHAYCRSGVCVREGIYMDYYKDGIANLPNFAQPYKEGDVMVLRLIRTGTTYIFQVSTDGKVFYTVGKRTSDMNPHQVGLVAGQNTDGLIIPALFDYFEVTRPQ